MGIIAVTAAWWRRALLVVFVMMLSIPKLAHAGTVYPNWAVGVAPSGTAFAVAASVTASAGYSYTTGSFSGNVSVPLANGTTITLISEGTSNVFVWKRDPSTGGAIWVQRFGGTGGCQGNGIAADSSGAFVTITGAFAGAMAVMLANGTEITLDSGPNPNRPDILVMKLDASTGGVMWAQRYGSSQNSDSGNGIALDASGNPYITGTYVPPMDFPLANGTTIVVTSFGGQDIYVMKLDVSTGLGLWMSAFSGSFNEFGSAVAVDASGNSYSTGNFNGPMFVKLANGTTVVLTTPNPGSGCFVIKLDSATGGALWTRGIVSQGSDSGSGIAVDASGTSYVTGSLGFSADLTLVNGTIVTVPSGFFVVKLEPSQGGYVWAQGLDGTSQGLGVALDSSSEACYTTGWFSRSVVIPMADGTNTTLTPAGGRDILTMKLDSSTGLGLWAQNFGTSLNGESGNGIAVDALSGASLTVGGFKGNMSIALSNGNTTVLQAIPTATGAFELQITTGDLLTQAPTSSPTQAPTSSPTFAPPPSPTSPIQPVGTGIVYTPEVFLTHQPLTPAWTPNTCAAACQARLNSPPTFLVNIYVDPDTNQQVCTCCLIVSGQRSVPGAQAFAYCSVSSSLLRIKSKLQPRKHVAPGKRVRYKALLGNADKRAALQNLALTVQLPAAGAVLVKRAASKGGQLKGGGRVKAVVDPTATPPTITWRNISLLPRKAMRFMVNVRVDKAVLPGTALVFRSSLYQELPVNGLGYCAAPFVNQTVIVK